MKIAWQLIRMQLLQVPRIEFGSLAGRISLLIFGLLQCLLLLSLYQSWLVTSAVQPQVQVEDRDFIYHLVVRGDYELYLPFYNHWYNDEIRFNPTRLMQNLREKLRNKPLKFEKNSTKMLQRLDEGDKALVFAQKDDFLFYKAAGYCEIDFVHNQIPKKVYLKKVIKDKCLFLQTAHFIFRKGASLRKEFDYALRSETVSIRRIVNFYKELNVNRRTRYCDEYVRKKRLAKPLGSYIRFRV